jgi:DNA-binding NarL/FixJ family response regulator
MRRHEPSEVATNYSERKRAERAMAGSTKTAAPTLPAAPWGYLPPSLRVLWVTTSRRGGAWLAESFAGDSACQVVLEEAYGAAAGLERLREQMFDAVLVSHAPGELDALELLDALRGGDAEEPLIVLGEASPQEMEALCLEAGADAYVCVNTATTRTLLWIVARATERHALLRENRRLAQAERHRLHQEHHEAERMLTQQRDLIRDAQAGHDPQAGGETAAESRDSESPHKHDMAEIGRRAGGSSEPPPLAESLKDHYRELLRAHVIMGSGNLAGEMAALAELLAASNVTAPQTMQLHVQVLEELVRGLGSRSARHVMTRADLLVLEVLVHLAERYRLRCQPPEDTPARQRP